MIWPETTGRTSNGHLSVGGQSLPRLAATYGTPLYVFDETTLRNRATRVARAIERASATGEFVFAAKACASPAILQIMAREGAGIDVVSGGELYAALQAGLDPESITFHGNNKSAHELEMAIENRVGLIVLDHFAEITQLDRIAHRGGVNANVLIRLNPGIDVHTHAKIATGVVDSKFGFPVWTSDALRAVEATLSATNLALRGYHAHLGSQIFDLDVPSLAITKLMEFAATVRDATGYVPQILSPGGGMGIAYTDSDEEVSADDWIKASVAAVRSICQTHEMTMPQLVFEPGRYLVGPAAVAVYEVGARKEIPSVRTYVSVDGGMADNIRPSLYGARYTAELANREPSGERETVTIAGRYCESGDVLIEDIDLPRLETGDLIAIPGAGAYTLSMASNYNLVPRPAAVLVQDGQVRLIRSRETMDDLLKNDLW